MGFLVRMQTLCNNMLGPLPGSSANEQHPSYVLKCVPPVQNVNMNMV